MGKNLKSLKGLWKKANENKGAGGFDEFEDGRYLTSISDAEVNESQGTGRLQIMIAYKVQEGEFAGKTKRSYTGLDTEMGVQIAVNTLARLGVEVVDPEELEEGIKELIGKVVKIQLKTKSGKSGEFQNVYVLKVMGKDAEETTPSTPKESASAEEVAEPAVEEVAEEIVDGEVELKVGMRVTFNLKKKEVEGEVLKIEEEKGSVIVEHKKKKYRVACESISLVE